MIERIKYNAWEMLTSIAMILDGIIGLLCLGFYRGTIHATVINVRTTKFSYIDNSEWDTSDMGVCRFFTGKPK